nr:histidine kinase [uncultured Flavobacterium sp.]
MRFYKHLLYFVFLFFITVATGQVLSKKKVTVQQGLASNTINEIFIDSYNNTWVATASDTYIYKNGVLFPFLYQGKSVVLNCKDIHQDSDGNLWFATYGNGLYKYDGNILTNFTVKEGLVSQFCNKIYDKGNFIYIGTQEGLSIYNSSQNTFFNPANDNFKKSSEFDIVDFTEINNNVFFISKTDGAFKVVNESRVARVVKIRNHNFADSIFIWNNRVYLAMKTKILVFTIKDYINNEAAFHEILIPNVVDFTSSNDSLIAISHCDYNCGGIFIINKDNTFKQYKNSDLYTNSFNSVEINHKEKRAFIGTNRDGFYIYEFGSLKKTFILDKKNVVDIQPFKNEVLIITNQEILKKSISDKIIAQLTADQILAKAKLKEQDNLQFYKVLTTPDQIYLSTNLGVFVLDETLTQVQYVNASDKPLVVYNDEPFNFEPYYLTNNQEEFIGNLYKDNPNRLPTNIKQALVFDEKIVLSTAYNGLFEINQDKVKSIHHSKEFLHKRIKLITQAIDNNILILTEFNGLFEVNPKNNYKVINHYEIDKLIGKNVFYVTYYKDFIVFGTEIGVEFLNPVTNKHLVLNKEFGLQLSTLLTVNIIADYLYVGGNEGYYKFDIPEFLNYNNKIQGVEIKSIFSENVSKPFYSANWLKSLPNKVTVSRESAPLTIQFFPVTQFDTESLLFRFRTNSQSKWSNYQKETFIQILNFKDDFYDIEVEFYDKVTQETKLVKLIQIKVESTNTTIYLFLGIFILLTGLVYGIYLGCKKYLKVGIEEDFNLADIQDTKALHFDTSSLKQFVVLNQSKDDISSEMKMFLNALNSHFIFNTLNYLHYQIGSEQTKPAINQTNKISSFFRQALKNANKTEISLENEIQFLNTYVKLEAGRFDFDIEFEVVNVNEIDFSDVYIPTFSLHPILETILNFSFTENDSDINVTLDIYDENDDYITIKYFYNGLSIEEIYNQPDHRLRKGIELLEHVLQQKNQQENVISFGVTQSNINYVAINIYL